MRIDLRGLGVQLGQGETAVRPIDDLDLTVLPGTLTAVVGASGCGKTTLLSMLAGILTPDRGTVEIDGGALTTDAAALLEHRRHTVGIVFQAFNLVASMTATENVAAPLLAAGRSRRAAMERAHALLDQVGLGDRRAHRPPQLSGGQQQRVAIARALAFDPPILLADEPTGHLDPLQVDGVLALLRTLTQDGRSIVVATHDDRLRPLADQVVDLGARDPVTAPEIELEPGEVLFQEGSRGHLIYVVQKGKLEVSRGRGEEREVVAVLGRHEHVGDMGALFQRPRSATVTAKTRAVVRSYSALQLAAMVGTERLDGLALHPPARRRTRTAR
jgi:putative ABC transport system ATP-binding protein